MAAEPACAFGSPSGEIGETLRDMQIRRLHPKYQPSWAYKKPVRKMQTIGRVQRILGRFFDFDDIETLIELKPLEDDEEFAIIVEGTGELAALNRYERRAISKRKIRDSRCVPFRARSLGRNNITD